MCSRLIIIRRTSFEQISFNTTSFRPMSKIHRARPVTASSPQQPHLASANYVLVFEYRAPSQFHLTSFERKRQFHHFVCCKISIVPLLGEVNPIPSAQSRKMNNLLPIIHLDSASHCFQPRCWYLYLELKPTHGEKHANKCGGR